MHRHVEVRRRGQRQPSELRRCDPHDRDGRATNGHRLADYLRITVELPTPVPVRQYRHGWRSALIILEPEPRPGRQLDTQGLEKLVAGEIDVAILEQSV